jgi:hypothetical protein
MPDQVFLVGTEEIVGVEARCSECKNTATFDLFATTGQVGEKCPFCGAEWPLHKAAVAALREAVKVARRAGDTIKLRVGTQQSLADMHKRS